MSLSINLREDSGYAVVELDGDLDLATASRLRRALLDVVGDGDSPIAVDIRAMTFMDSSGLSVLLGAHRRAKEAERELVLVAPSHQVREILRLTQADAVISVKDALGDAAAAPDDEADARAV